VGLFDLFSRKAKQSLPAPSPAEAPNAPAPPPALATPSAPEPDQRLSPWQQSVWRAEQSPAFAWSDDNGRARLLVRSLLERVAAAFGNGTVVQGEPPPILSLASVLIQQFGEGLVEWQSRLLEVHGVWDGIPVRIPVSIPAKKFWTIVMRCEQRGRGFVVLRDHKRVPRAAAPNDPWAKSQPACVFLGKGIFLDDSDPGLMRDLMVPSWASLPASAQQLVVQEMERLNLRCFALSNTDETLLALGSRTLGELEDPLAYLAACATMMAEVARALSASSAEAARASLSSSAPPQSVTCRYCRSIFLLSTGKNTCPNCGAPAG
jgi:hypothetical protein